MARKYINKLEGKSVLVVGGTSGIGFAVAEASVEYGARVVVASRSQSKIADATARLRAAYPEAKDRIRGHVVDLHSDDCETSITELLDFVTRGGREEVDHIVETAGGAAGEAGDITLEGATPWGITEYSRTRVVGAVVLAKVAARYLRREAESSLTMTSGVAAYRPSAGWGVRAAVIGAKEALARGLAVDMRPVRVNLVSPGAVQTELLDRSVDGMGGDPEVVKRAFCEASLLGRIGSPEDLAETYLSLMKNYFVTGTTVHVEGGMLLK